MPRRYPYCPHCSSSFVDKLLHGYTRQVCPDCGFVFWQNPAVGVAVIILDGDRVVLGRRSRGVYQGAWCIPCGYVEYDEEVRLAAQREFQEETGLVVEVGEVYAVHSNFHNPAMHTVGIWFRGVVKGGALQPDDDLDEVAYVALRDLPANLAFPTDRLVLDQLHGDLYGFA
ncbi:MAG: NUDIX hydrolase [bacterium]|nr:NUDIX hydrolase [bacterium]